MKNKNWLPCKPSMPCPICGRKKYCCITLDGRFILCTKVDTGAVKSVSTGWLHRNTSGIRPVLIEPKDKPTCTFRAEMITEHTSTREAVAPLAEFLGVTPESLLSLGCFRFTDRREPVWGFPMRDHTGKIVGIKCRNLRKRKWCVSGSSLGLYLPKTVDLKKPLFVCEGESDTAAMLSAGFQAIGRPSASTGTKDLIAYIGQKPVTILADNDASGLGLTESIRLWYCLNHKSCIVLNPAYKDVREWFSSGTLNRAAMIQNIVWPKRKTTAIK